MNILVKRDIQVNLTLRSITPPPIFSALVTKTARRVTALPPLGSRKLRPRHPCSRIQSRSFRRFVSFIHFISHSFIHSSVPSLPSSLLEQSTNQPCRPTLPSLGWVPIHIIHRRQGDRCSPRSVLQEEQEGMARIKCIRGCNHRRLSRYSSSSSSNSSHSKVIALQGV